MEANIQHHQQFQLLCVRLHFWFRVFVVWLLSRTSVLFPFLFLCFCFDGCGNGKFNFSNTLHHLYRSYHCYFSTLFYESRSASAQPHFKTLCNVPTNTKMYRHIDTPINSGSYSVGCVVEYTLYTCAFRCWELESDELIVKIFVFNSVIHVQIGFDLNVVAFVAATISKFTAQQQQQQKKNRKCKTDYNFLWFTLCSLQK